jgi:GntR family transcriptional regulator/MocR family aminotransferase
MAAQREPVSGRELLLALDRSDPSTLHEQLERALRDAIRSGRLTPGTRLPSSRALAAQLHTSRGVVLEAYGQLTAEGYLTSSQGAPTRVASAPRAERPPVPASSLERQPAYSFDPTLPDLAAFPREQWLRSLRTALREARFADLGHSDPRGAPVVRNELMAYLGRARGAAPEPEHTIVCAGFTQALSLLCRSLRGRGLERIAIEDPGWAQHRLIAAQAGLEPVPIPVDERGIDVEQLERSACETVILTPAHQFPTGGVLSSERRASLLDWAEDHDALIVEDDYDSELRYDRGPVGALQGLAPERVCYIGSLSKRLAPGMRIGWMLSPSWLTGALTYEKGISDGGSPVPEQLALADFLARGDLDRHVRRMRLRYRRRRDVLLGALAKTLPEASVAGIAAGLYVLALLPANLDEAAVVSAAAARGVGVEGLSWHRLAAAGPAGLVLGFANLSEPAIQRGVRLLAEAVAAAR